MGETPWIITKENGQRVVRCRYCKGGAYTITKENKFVITDMKCSCQEPKEVIGGDVY